MNQQEIQKIDKLSTSYKFAKNSIYNVIGFIVTFPILILLTPYMLNVLGKAQFGIWAIAGVVTSYAQLSDMGMTTAIVKFVAEHWVKRDVTRISKVVSTAFFSFAVVGGVVTTSILFAGHFIVINLLKVPPDMQSEALFVVSGVVIIFYFNLLFSVYNSVLLGTQRMDVTNAIMVVSKVLRAFGMWAFLAAGLGLKGLIWNSAIFSALTIGANVFWSIKLTEGLKVNLFWFSLAELRRILKFSVNVFLAFIMGLGQDPLNKIILAAYTSLPFVSFYEVGSRVKNMVRQLFQVGLAPLLPAISELNSMKGKQEMEKMYLSISRFLYIFTVPIFLLVIVLADPIVKVWLGDGYKMAAKAIQFLLLGNLFSLLVTPQYIILQGIGKPGRSTFVSGLNCFLNVVIAIALVSRMGFLGVLIAVLVSLFLASVLMIYLFHITTRYSFLEYIQSFPIKFLTIGCILNGGLWLISKRLDNLACTFGTAAAFSIFYMFLLIWGLEGDDKTFFAKMRSAIVN